MIMKPSNISPAIPTDASLPIAISWRNSGDRQYAFSVVVYNNADNSLVYNTGKIISFNSFHTISSGTLTNGITYKYQVIVFNINSESATSDYILLKCSSIPICSFINIGTEILNSSYSFAGGYSQAEGVLLKSWQMFLYNEYEEIIGYSPIVYSQNIEYEFSGLSTERNYKIELQTRSQDNLLGTTGKTPFYVRYSVPKTAILLTAEDVDASASVRLQWNVIQIIGEYENATFIDNEKINVLNGKVYFDKDFNINSDFTLRLWVENITENSELNIIGSTGNYLIKYLNNRFYLYKNTTVLNTIILSNELQDIIASTPVYLCIQQIGNLTNITCEVV